MEDNPTSYKPNFAFVDADNFRKQFDSALARKTLEKKCFNFISIFEFERHDRWYFYSATNVSSQIPEWLQELEEQDRCVLKFGDLVQTGRRQSQKGVDVKLAVDATRLAYTGVMKSMALYGGDRDFKPLIEAVSDSGVFTTVCSFDNPAKGQAAGLMRACADKYEHWGVEQLEKCIVGGVAKLAPGAEMNFAFHSPSDAFSEFTTKNQVYRYLEQSGKYFLVFKTNSKARDWRVFQNQSSMKNWLLLQDILPQPH